MTTIAHAAHVPPGPSGHPLLGSTPDFLRDPLQAFFAARRDYGDVVRFRLGGPQYAFFVAHPDQIRQVLLERTGIYRKAPFYNDKLKQLVGEGLLTSEGDAWLHQRRLMQPAFHHQKVRALGATVERATSDMLDRRWPDLAAGGQPVDVFAEMTRLALVIVARSLLGRSVSDDEVDAVSRAVSVAGEFVMRDMRGSLGLPAWMPLPSNRRFRQARATLDRFVRRMIDDERLQSDSCEGELLSLLLESRDEATGVPLAARELREQVLTIVMAGHETVGVTLSWTWYLLSLHPNVAHLLRNELSTVLGGRPPTADDLTRLEYTAMVIAESMRLYPAAWCLERMPVVDDELANYRIQAGSTVFLVPYVTHRHPEFWQNPEGFDPQRFTPEQSADRPRFAYFPFGGGPRQCIGNSFALMEAQLILATVAQRYDLDLLPGHPVVPEPKVTLRPKYGMMMTLRPATRAE